MRDLGVGAGFWVRGRLASKDIAESPTAIAGTPKFNLQLTMYN